jgi:hypothetical protein
MNDSIDRGKAQTLLTDESGQAMAEKVILVVILTLPVIFIFGEVIDGFVSYYSYIVGVICLPIP